MDITTEAFQATLLEPLTYHTAPDTGAGGASITGPFLGDIALNYAVHYALHGHPIPVRHGTILPDYREDHKRFLTLCSVGIPEGDIRYMSPENEATSPMSEGYEQIRIKANTTRVAYIDGKMVNLPNTDKRGVKEDGVTNIAFRGWRSIQSLAPWNSFSFIASSRKKLPEVFTIRMGYHRGCLIRVQKIPRLPRECTLNIYTITKVFERQFTLEEGMVTEMPTARYQLVHGVPREKAIELMSQR